jgi:nucleotide-binding universal stress UspA family protein
MLPIRTILHPTDFSTSSDYAFRLACSLARDYGSRLIVLHVATPPVVAFGEGVLPVQPEGYRDELREWLHRLAAQGPTARVEHHLVEGDAAAEIIHLAGETKCDLIVMGTHGRTGLGRLLMGSVAEQVIRKAPCPVLTVKSARHPESPSEEAVAVTAAGTVEAGE